ncbi:unnamed protein product [Didymodactylos carnosus]|uniref:E3 ubiquitin-protein ligase PPP1R11 n=1 Tax=Didymodactylos carnosus TaxID=1234261 RepID=A0A814W724_9BILA|nr:unnamed protein product [Didymodactylos carnosus]CAF1198180.1 unnamed protein product [Didymodactylos carnosus]CAF3540659.1 unnamed protein product [Didymodactylos carnosus]CAF3962553.1 unnamed protein product [Didymodactylos carnosus]
MASFNNINHQLLPTIDDRDMYLSVLHKSSIGLLNYESFSKVRQTVLKYNWVPCGVTFYGEHDNHDYALEFDLVIDEHHCYYLRVPWNIDYVPIQCHLSAKSMANAGYSWTLKMLDRILRLLCNCCPGLFELSYTNGLFGRQPSLWITYDGLNNTQDYQRDVFILQNKRLARDLTQVIYDHDESDVFRASLHVLGHGKCIGTHYYYDLSTMTTTDTYEDGSSTITVSAHHNRTQTESIKLRSHSPTLLLSLERPRTGARVRWTEETVDNEFMNKKKSKCCCIYIKSSEIDDLDENDDGIDDANKRSDDNEFSHCEHCRYHVTSDYQASNDPDRPNRIKKVKLKIDDKSAQSNANNNFDKQSS